MLFGNDANTLDASFKNTEETIQKNQTECELDLNEIVIGVDRAKKSTPTNPNSSDKKEESLETTDAVKDLDFKNTNSATVPPSDCSIKSRALYESFRGKNSTLERPKRQRESILNSVSSEGGCSHAVSSSHRTSESSYDESLRAKTIKSSRDLTTSDSELLSKAFSLLETRELNKDSQNSNKEEIHININNEQTIQKTESLSSNTPTPSPRPKLTLKKQLTINSDKSSLSSILNENLYK